MMYRELRVWQATKPMEENKASCRTFALYILVTFRAALGLKDLKSGKQTHEINFPFTKKIPG